MKRPVGTALQPLAGLSRLVRRDVVEDNVHRGFRLNPLGNMIEEGEKLLRAVPVNRLVDDLAGGDVEGCEQARRAVPPVVVRRISA